MGTSSAAGKGASPETPGTEATSTVTTPGQTASSGLGTAFSHGWRSTKMTL